MSFTETDRYHRVNVRFRTTTWHKYDSERLNRRFSTVIFGTVRQLQYPPLRKNNVPLLKRFAEVGAASLASKWINKNNMINEKGLLIDERVAVAHGRRQCQGQNCYLLIIILSALAT